MAQIFQKGLLTEASDGYLIVNVKDADRARELLVQKIDAINVRRDKNIRELGTKIAEIGNDADSFRKFSGELTARLNDVQMVALAEYSLEVRGQRLVAFSCADARDGNKSDFYFGINEHNMLLTKGINVRLAGDRPWGGCELEALALVRNSIYLGLTVPKYEQIASNLFQSVRTVLKR